MIWIIFLLVFALIFGLVSLHFRRQTGLPSGEIISSDTKMWGAPLEQPLFDGSLGITGKPDYLVRKGEDVIPVEVKSTRTPKAPYDAHIFQLALYCLLVEKVFQHTPPHGLIHYPEHTFAISFTGELKEKTLDLISEMHQMERHKNIPRSHEEAWKCLRCGYRDICNQKIQSV